MKRSLPADAEESGIPSKQYKPARTLSRLLKHRFPEIFAQIHPTKNEELKIDTNKLTYGSKTSLWWKCLEHKTCDAHVWFTSVNNRTTRQGCRFCTGRQTCRCDSFGCKFPDLLKEFIAAGNDEKIAYTTSCGSHEEFSWKCSAHVTCDRHIWTARVSVRTGGHGCSYCDGKQTCPCNSFATRYPDLLEEFIAGGNSLEFAHELSYASNKLVTWKCGKHKECDGHVWNATIADRTVGGYGCSYCAGNRGYTCRCLSFGNHHSDLVAEFVGAGNDINLAFSIPQASNKYFNWQCRNNSAHVWPAQVQHRTKKLDPTGCPNCTTSKFERDFILVLDGAETKYEKQKTFPDCRSINVLPFDFAWEDCLAELDGQQHFEAGRFNNTEEDLAKQQKHDKIKTEFAKSRSLHLLRIAWSERNNMKQHFQSFQAAVKAHKESKQSGAIQQFCGQEYGDRNILSHP